MDQFSEEVIHLRKALRVMGEAGMRSLSWYR